MAENELLEKISEKPEEVLTFEETAEFSDGGNDEEEYERYERQQKKKRRKKMIIYSSIGLLALIIAGSFIISRIAGSGKKKGTAYTDIEVSRRTIENTITGSSYIKPNDSYKVTTIHSGDITADYFKEGDKVKKDDKLYQLDDDDAENSYKTAKNALSRAQQAYSDAVRAKSDAIKTNNSSMKSAQNGVQRALISLNSAKRSADDRSITSDIDGKVSAVNIKEGDEVNIGAVIASVYNDSAMQIRLPFNEFDAANIYEGAEAEVSVVGTSETISGIVTDVSDSAVTSKANTMVVYATIELDNPGALDESDSGSAFVNGAACSDTAKFKYIKQRHIISKVSGTVESVDIDEGSFVYSGEQIAYITSDSAADNLKTAQLSYDDAISQLNAQVVKDNTYSQDSNIKTAQLALDDAKLNLKKAQDAVDDYLIKAPIEGTVVTKNAKSGDTIDSQNSAEPLCVIYDLSSVKFTIDVDETEISLVKVGQKATVTADAVSGKFEGVVKKVPVDGVYENGVTTYTIEIEIKKYGDLLPGMNIDASIVVEEAENVLSIPVNAVNTGNIVFVKDNGKTYKNDVTDMLKGKGDNKKKTNKKSDDKDDKSDSKEINDIPSRKDGSENNGKTGDLQAGTKNAAGEKAGGGIDLTNLPVNLEVPEGYRAVVLELGINDNDYIEIISGLKEGDEVRTIDAKASSSDASFDLGARMHPGMMGGGMSGGAGGRTSGGPGGGMPGGGR